MKNKDSKQTKDWFDKAYHDLMAAKTLFEEDGFSDTIAVHCHQTAEKSLKGALLNLQVDYPFTHDLSLLIKICIKKDKEFKKIQEAAINLSPLYEEERYPFFEAEPHTDRELQDFINFAEDIYNFVNKKL